ncbi:MAG: ABC transporter ATP-binding protein [Candidatus Omnitrophota bacterium]
MMSEILAADNLSKMFKQGVKAIHAIRDTGFSLGEQERIVIHGPSGAGKSTLLHVLAGLDRPTSGSVVFRGRDIYAMSDRKRSALRNRSFGFVFQFYHLLPELNVFENVMMPAMIRGEERSGHIRSRAVYLLEKVGMKDRLRHRPSMLSGGESQRTAIARALMNSTDILFCDEPTGNLDSEMRRDIYAVIREVSEEKKMSVIVVSHQAVGEEDFWNTRYMMKDGALKKVSEYQSARVSKKERIINGIESLS